MTNPHLRTAVWVPVLAAVACGGASATSSGGASVPGQGGSELDASMMPSEDAGPTTTTTVGLGSGGKAEGSKLTPAASAEAPDGAADGGAKGTHPGDVGRSPKDIQAIVVSRRDEARACYDAALKTHPGIEGNLDVRWTIDPKGNVTDIAVDTSDSDILEPTVGNCVIAILKSIHFNESAKGFETRTHYPFNFHPRSGGTFVVRPDGGAR